MESGFPYSTPGIFSERSSIILSLCDFTGEGQG